MSDERATAYSGIGALSEPARRGLYEYVASQDVPVGREQAAEAMGIPLHSAKFHLDRLVEEGLLEVEFRRLTGKSGPGAGRPAKLYRRSPRQISVSLPERRYDLAGEVLAEAVDRSMREATPVAEAVREAATGAGRRMAESSRRDGSQIQQTAEILSEHGYEPRVSQEGDEICLANCPFDRLAREHTELVCSLNHALVSGVLDELQCTELEARLDPEPGMCCVKTRVRG